MSRFDLEVGARTLYGEARGEPRDGKVAVAWVIRNRMADERWPDYASEVCLQRFQFSVWWFAGGNLDATMRQCDAAVDEFVAIFHAVMVDAIPDPTSGANHYLTEAVARSANRPTWFTWQKVTTKRGNHIFLKL